MWWRDGVLYHVYVRSFADTNGDGVGDLPGIVSRLDHLAWLGVDAVWLSPVSPSPDADWGYDVSDYTAVQPVFGTLDDFDRLVDEAAQRGIRVVCDLVPNHTSDQHPWFRDARSSRDARHRDWYVWADPAPDGGPPNNWVSNFGGPAWTLDEGTGQYYLHNFLASQPDLNWWNTEVRDAFEEIMRFWLDRGVGGFRIDVCHMLAHDPELRDNPPATDDDHLEDQLRGQRQVYNANLPEVHEIIRRWRATTDAYDARMLLGETYFFDLRELATYYGDDDELHLAFNFPFVFAPLAPEELQRIVHTTESVLPSDAWPVWTGSNHDAGRFPTRWCDDDERKVRSALMMLLTLRGTPVLYYGDETGMPNVPVPREEVLDPVGQRFWPFHKGRDPGRTPMPWSSEPGYGFTDPDVQPWVRFGEHGGRTVADQRADPSSVLHLTRRLIALRREREDLRTGAYEAVDATDGVWAWKRGDHTVVAINLSDTPAPLGSGRILVSTIDGRQGEVTDEIGPWEGIVLEV